MYGVARPTTSDLPALILEVLLRMTSTEALPSGPSNTAQPSPATAKPPAERTAVAGFPTPATRPFRWGGTSFPGQPTDRNPHAHPSYDDREITASEELPLPLQARTASESNRPPA